MESLPVELVTRITNLLSWNEYIRSRHVCRTWRNCVPWTKAIDWVRRWVKKIWKASRKEVVRIVYEFHESLLGATETFDIADTVNLIRYLSEIGEINNNHLWATGTLAYHVLSGSLFLSLEIKNRLDIIERLPISTWSPTVPESLVAPRLQTGVFSLPFLDKFMEYASPHLVPQLLELGSRGVPHNRESLRKYLGIKCNTSEGWKQVSRQLLRYCKYAPDDSHLRTLRAFLKEFRKWFRAQLNIIRQTENMDDLNEIRSLIETILAIFVRSGYLRLAGPFPNAVFFDSIGLALQEPENMTLLGISMDNLRDKIQYFDRPFLEAKWKLASFTGWSFNRIGKYLRMISGIVPLYRVGREDILEYIVASRDNELLAIYEKDKEEFEKATREMIPPR